MRVDYRCALGAGSVMGAGICAAITISLTGLAMAGGGFVSHNRIATVADDAALSAADARRGIIPAIPCDVAQEIAGLHELTVIECVAVDAGVKIRLSGEFMGIPLSAYSYAGEPG